MMKTIVCFGALLLSGAALAQAPSGATQNDGGANPNERVCRNQTDTSSRLSRSRVCMTRAQWEARRREQRQTLEQGQRTRSSGSGQ